MSLLGRHVAMGLVLFAAAARAQERVDLDAMNRIRDEGLNRSQVMSTLEELVDRYGPRLTGSPTDKAAAEWAKAKLAGWGLEGAHLEGFAFGEGWSYSKSAVRIVAPFTTSVYALPVAWTPGTGGAVRGLAVRVTLDSDDDYKEQRGKLKGKIVLLSEPREAKPEAEAKPEDPLRRFARAELDELLRYPIPDAKPRDWYARARKRFADGEKRDRFLVEEGALAAVQMSFRDNGVVSVYGGGSRGIKGRGRGVPTLVMAAEPYERIVRLVERDVPVELELDVDAEFQTADTKAYNVVAEIPGTDRKDEVVMVGGHLDAWHAATGATDNGAGVAVAMEAVRILEAAGLKPRRTVRIALWSGEEQGEIGSNAYVHEHLADRPENSDPDEAQFPTWLRSAAWPIHPKPEHARLSAYFNVDNGSGKIRGVYAQSNVAAMPIFKAWLEPLKDLGADTVVSQDTGATDHESFDAVGLPGFQFIQDELDYESRTHHTNLDTYEHAHREDLIQAAVVLASFAWDTAARDELMPRKPMPQAPPKPPTKKAPEKRPAMGGQTR